MTGPLSSAIVLAMHLSNFHNLLLRENAEAQTSQVLDHITLISIIFCSCLSADSAKPMGRHCSMSIALLMLLQSSEEGTRLILANSSSVTNDPGKLGRPLQK